VRVLFDTNVLLDVLLEREQPGVSLDGTPSLFAVGSFPKRINTDAV
jgi:hypothetical protein